ncbi:MAG: hypothetical protein WKG00_34550 [Polyangiaceae bacterium]
MTTSRLAEGESGCSTSTREARARRSGKALRISGRPASSTGGWPG